MTDVLVYGGPFGASTPTRTPGGMVVGGLLDFDFSAVEERILSYYSGVGPLAVLAPTICGSRVYEVPRWASVKHGEDTLMRGDSPAFRTGRWEQVGPSYARRPLSSAQRKSRKLRNKIAKISRKKNR